jgi:hypothetical protein
MVFHHSQEEEKLGVGSHVAPTALAEIFFRDRFQR